MKRLGTSFLAPYDALDDLAAQFEAPADELVKVADNGENPFDAADPAKIAAE
ncbi:hypothetical protein [Mesorhizobium sp.]|uniref:hypothetical protein n=1 Tax=Mesorhizobium sp. TaxID=1871066 RepID=UPI0025E252AB|nr:hypothetical protein [Mesorhizobium sp.]